MEPNATPLIEVQNLTKYFPIRKGLLGRVKGHVKAVDDISFNIYPRETLGLVGESGCGKTTAGRSLLRLIEPTNGRAHYKGVDLFQLDARSMRTFRRHLQIIFQDPFSSLNPRMTVESIIGEAMRIHRIVPEDEIRGEVGALLERVGLQASYATRYPHEFSGGQRQRIGIARALALKPEFIVCDEAVSALDVSVQAQVINLLQDLQDEFDLSFLFIAHDLSVVRHISDRVAVMYLGRIAELADCDELYRHPAHPYTQSLLSAIPEPNPRRVKERIILQGDVPTPINPPSGCRFHTRCPAAYSRCRVETPELTEVASGHFVACHLYTEPSRANLTLKQAQQQVNDLVKTGASTILTNARRFGVDPTAKLVDVELPRHAMTNLSDEAVERALNATEPNPTPAPEAFFEAEEDETRNVNIDWDEELDITMSQMGEDAASDAESVGDSPISIEDPDDDET